MLLSIRLLSIIPCTVSVVDLPVPPVVSAEVTQTIQEATDLSITNQHNRYRMSLLGYSTYKYRLLLAQATFWDFILTSSDGVDEADRLVLFDKLNTWVKPDVVMKKVMGKFGAIPIDGVNWIE